MGESKLPSNDSMSSLAEAMAGRLRLHQANYADVAPEERRRVLDDEIRRALSKIVPQQRRVFLEQLEQRFPSAIEADTPSTGAASPAALKDPLALVEEIIARCQTASWETRQAVLERLRAGGLIPPPPPASATAPAAELPGQPLRDVRAALELSPDESLDPARLLEMLKQLIDFAGNLDDVVWNIWSQIAPQSPLRRENKFRNSLSRFAKDKPSGAGAAEKRDREKLMRVNVAMLTSLLRVSPPLFETFFGSVSPANIWANTPGTDRLGMPFKSAACWKAFEEAARALDLGNFQAALYREVGRITSRLANQGASAQST